MQKEQPNHPAMAPDQTRKQAFLWKKISEKTSVRSRSVTRRWNWSRITLKIRITNRLEVYTHGFYS